MHTTLRDRARHEQTAAVLAQRGFETQPASLEDLEPFLPFDLLARPCGALLRSTGRVGEAQVSIFLYAAETAGRSGPVYVEKMVAAVCHPRLSGRAAARTTLPRQLRVLVAESPALARPFLALALFLVLLLAWPVLLAMRLVGHTPQPRRRGVTLFDRAFRVYSPSDDAAQRALPSRLCEHLVDSEFNGAIEVRDGHLLCVRTGDTFHPEHAERLLKMLPALIEAAVPRAERPFR
jgi:hypothetical protein